MKTTLFLLLAFLLPIALLADGARNPGDYYSGGGGGNVTNPPYQRAITVYGSVNTNDFLVFMDRTGSKVRGTNLMDQVQGWAQSYTTAYSNWAATVYSTQAMLTSSGTAWRAEWQAYVAAWGLTGTTARAEALTTNGADGLRLAAALTNYTINAGTEIVVDQGGKGNYTTIAGALAEAAAIHATNATALVNIRVCAGYYTEDVTIAAYTLMRGEARRSRITGTATVTGAPVYIDGVYFLGTGAATMTFNGVAWAAASSLDNCYIVNSGAIDGPLYGIVITNSTGASGLRVFNSEIYPRNTSAGASAKTIAIGAFSNAAGVYAELINTKIKTSSSGKANTEYLVYADGSFETEIQNSVWYSFHDTSPKIHVDDTAHVAWEDSSLSNWTAPTNTFATEGTSATPLIHFSKETGSLKVNGTLTVTGAVSAASYTGSGAPLTGLTVGQVAGAVNSNGGVATNITLATLFNVGRVYLGADTNSPYVTALGTTNFQFVAGTNSAIFGW